MTTPGIEETVLGEALAVNSKAMLARIMELLDELGTNCLSEESARSDPRIRAVLWLLNQQVFGQLGLVDMMEEYSSVAKGLREWLAGQEKEQDIPVTKEGLKGELIDEASTSFAR